MNPSSSAIARPKEGVSSVAAAGGTVGQNALHSNASSTIAELFGADEGTDIADDDILAALERVEQGQWQRFQPVASTQAPLAAAAAQSKQPPQQSANQLMSQQTTRITQHHSPVTRPQGISSIAPSRASSSFRPSQAPSFTPMQLAEQMSNDALQSPSPPRSPLSHTSRNDRPIMTSAAKAAFTPPFVKSPAAPVSSSGSSPDVALLHVDMTSLMPLFVHYFPQEYSHVSTATLSSEARQEIQADPKWIVALMLSRFFHTFRKTYIRASDVRTFCRVLLHYPTFASHISKFLPGLEQEMATHPAVVITCVQCAMHHTCVAPPIPNQTLPMEATLLDPDSDIEASQRMEEDAFPIQLSLPSLIVRFRAFRPVSALKDAVKAASLGKFLCVQGTVVRTSPVRPAVEQMQFECTRCKKRKFATFKDNIYTPPQGCDPPCHNKQMEPDRITAQCVDYQIIKLQEIIHNANYSSIANADEEGDDSASPASSSHLTSTALSNLEDQGRVPRTLEVHLFGADLADSAIPGDVVSVAGFIKSRKQESGFRGKNASVFILYLEANSVTKATQAGNEEMERQTAQYFKREGSSSEEGQSSTTLTLPKQPSASSSLDPLAEFSSAELRAIRDLASASEKQGISLLKMLVASVCPTIYGHEVVKAGLLLALLGGVNKNSENHAREEDSQAIPGSAGAASSSSKPEMSSQMSVRGDIHVLIVGDPGLGKCFGRGTKLLMYDGSTKAVEAVRESDKLMGDDSKPRMVLKGSLTHSLGQMYRITRSNTACDSWTCNADHILVVQWERRARAIHRDGHWMMMLHDLQPGVDLNSFLPRESIDHSRLFDNEMDAIDAYGARYGFTPLTFECSVRDYLSLSVELQRQLYMFQPQEIHFPLPSESNSVQQALFDVARQFTPIDRIMYLIGSKLVQPSPSSARTKQDNNPNSIVEHICSTMQPAGRLPFTLLTESLTLRRALLAGILDACAVIVDQRVIMRLSSHTLATDVMHLARGAGFIIGQLTISSQNELHLAISGNFHELPTNRKCFSDCCDSNTYSAGHLYRSAFRVEPVGVDEYFGFAVDGNHRFLLADFTVTHNSQMLRATSKASPRGVYISGGVTSKTGLTVTMVRDGKDGDFALEAGALVLADQGCCCIDEFDKMTSEHNALLEAMEQQSISIAKAGMVCSLAARTSVIAAANPVGGHYNRGKTVSENLKIGSPLLSRFDLVFIILDQPNSEKDQMLSEHIIRFHGRDRSARSSAAALPIRAPASSSSDAEARALAGRLVVRSSDQDVLWKTNERGQQEVDLLPIPLVRKFIAYAKKYCRPLLSKGARTVLSEFYLSLRSRAGDSTPITTRQLEALIRLSEARAKADLREVVTQQHAEDVVAMMRESMLDVFDENGAGGFGLEGLMDGSRANPRGGMSKAGLKKKFVALLRRKAEQKMDQVFTSAELYTLHEDAQLKHQIDDFAAFIESLNIENYLIKIGPKRYKLMTSSS